MDTDADKVVMINSGKLPTYETSLQDLLAKVVGDGSLRCTAEIEEAVLGSEITFVTVSTPSLRSGGVDLRSVRTAAKNIGGTLRGKHGYHLVVISSTVTPGTSESVVQPIVEKFSGKCIGKDFGLCMNPHFLKQGSAVHDIFHPHLVVIGEHDRRSGNRLRLLYKSLFDEMVPITRVNLRTAEMIKYANNAFLATKISFINTMANICERIGNVDVVDVAKAIGADPRIGPHFLKAGVGFGGSCLPKDLRALTAFAEKHGYSGTLLKAVSKVNENQSRRAYELAGKALGTPSGKQIAILGLAFKAGTDDTREAPSIRLIKQFMKGGSKVKAYDPVAMEDARSILPEVTYAESAMGCLERADCCVIVTEWNEFSKIRPEDLKSRMRTPILIDGRRICDPKTFSKKLRYIAIGFNKNSRLYV